MADNARPARRRSAMNCEQATEQLGPYVDGELSSDVRGTLEAHLETCGPCRAELGKLRDMAADLAKPPGVPVPESLWMSIERRLDAEPQAPSTVAAPRGQPSPAWSIWYRRPPLAVAAVLALAIGLGIFGLVWTEPSASAAVDYSVLLDALPRDARGAFRKFLMQYNAREASSLEAKRYAPNLNFDVPEVLPGGFRREAVYVLRFGDLPGVAASYQRDGEFLGVVFHRPVQKESFGPHRDYPCMVGRHEGRTVSVGQWKLVHLMDPTTCHCVLSRLDEQTELPGVMAAVAPGLPEGGGGHPH